MTFEIQELTRLVEEERSAEEKIKKAEQDALDIKDKARKKAQEIVRKAESGEFLENLEKKKMREIEGRKKSIQAEYKNKIQELDKKAERELDTFVSKVIEKVMGVET